MNSVKMNSIRTCIATHKEFPKEELVRIVKTNDSRFFVNSKVSGRGCYVSKTISPDEVVRKRLLHRAFKTEVPEMVYAELISVLKGETSNG